MAKDFYKCPYCGNKFECWEMGTRTEHEEFWGASISVGYDICPFCKEDITDEDGITEEEYEEDLI